MDGTFLMYCSGCRLLKCSECLFPDYLTRLGDLQAVLEFIERNRTAEIVKMHVVEIFNLTPEQVHRDLCNSMQCKVWQARCLHGCHFQAAAVIKSSNGPTELCQAFAGQGAI